MARPKFINDFLGAPKRFEGGLILNLLGYHFLRILRYRLAFTLRRKIVPNDEATRRAADEVEREGIVVIPNFFPDETFRKIKEEADRLVRDVVNERAPCIVRSVVVADGRPSSSALFEEHFAKNPFINGVASAALRKKVIFTPTIQSEKSWCAAEDLGAESTDKADNRHFDVSYPTIKAFLYLNDVDASNAAFMYARRSKRMTLARAWMEYVMCVKFWFWDKEARENVTPEVPQEFLDAQGLKLESVGGKANTLLIVDTMGFHRRGDYATTTPRELVHVSYRVLDSFKYFVQENLRKN